MAEHSKENGWTPEPWRLCQDGSGFGPSYGEGHLVLGVALYSYDGSGLAKANARRIVAAVNSVAGIPTEALESGVVAEMREALRLVQQWLLFTAPMNAPDSESAAADQLMAIANALANLRFKGALDG